ncbi:MAG: hypothetical protein LBV72_02120 [Tannerella sp.]|jgi:hypothetical protein|nr:hypothetical protein [Tannerella sp.]
MKQRNILYTIACTLFVLSGLYGCIDDPEFDSGVRNAKAPEIGELIISGRDKTASTITLKSSVLQANGYPVTERGFMWNTDSVIPENDKDKQLQVGEGIGEYTDTIKNLSPGVLYYFWSYARNEIDVSYSKYDSTSTGSGLGRLKTYFIEEDYKYATRAKISGKINLPGEGKTLIRGVYYSKSETFENKITIESKTPFEQDSFVCQLSGLSPETPYYAQAFVTNEVSDKTVTTLGDAVVKFETGHGKPVVAGILELQTGYSYIDVISQIIHVGDTAIEKWGFCWGTNSGPVVERDSFLARSGVQVQYIVATIENLEPEQQYFIRAYATNKYGTTYGEEQEFYVKNDKPTVQTLDPAYDYDAGTVFVNGLIYDKGKSDIITRGICYSNTVQEPTISNTKIEISTTGDNFSQNISGLKGDTKYYIRAYATNSEGISYGGVKEITTPNALMASSDVFPGSVRLSGSSAYFTIGNKGYLLGGDKGPSYIDELWSYNGSTGNWQQLQPQPVFSAKGQSVAVKGNLAYVLGGLSSGNVLMDDFRRYNSSSNIWGDPLTGGPDPAYSRISVTLEDVAYFIGGMGDTAKSEVWSYNITPNVWVQKPDFPVKQYGGIALNVDDEIYAGMGKDGAHICNKTIWKLNADLSTWTQETDNSLISGGVLAGVVYNQKIYLIDESFYIHEYDLLSKTWTKKIRINAGDQDVHGMFVINDKIYIGLINNKMYKYCPLWDN